MTVKHVSLFGKEVGEKSDKKKRVCLDCYQGKKVANPELLQRVAMEHNHEEDVDDNANMLLQGFSNFANTTGKIGKGLGTKTLQLGEGVMKGTADVTMGVAKGGLIVGKGVGNVGGELWNVTKKGIKGLVQGKYTIEVPLERSMNKKFVDRPEIRRSKATKLISLAGEKIKSH